MGAVSSLNSLMAVLAPVIGAPLLGVVSHLPQGDWRIGAPLYFCAALQAAALLLAWRHFRRQPRAARLPPHRPDLPPDMHDKILILDFGSQVTQLIARRVREAHVYCEIHPNDVERRLHPRVRAQGHHPVGQPRQHLRRARPARAAGGVGPAACRCWASATACSRWRCSRAARSRPARTASSATPRCARTATPSCSKASRTSPRPKATACSRSG